MTKKEPNMGLRKVPDYSAVICFMWELIDEHVIEIK